MGNRKSSGFTLIELLVVIGIIALLAGILFPTIRKMRIASQEADSRNLVNQLDQACQAYYLTNTAYPGPLSNAQLDAATQPPLYDVATGGTPINTSAATFGTASTETTFAANAQRVTGSENLFLAICGGLALDRTVVPNRIWYDVQSVGQGPMSLNPAKVGRTDAYLPDSNSTKTTGGRAADESGAATGIDSIIPEFQDRFAAPMPVLYMRSSKQGTSSGTAQTLVVNNSTPGDYNIVEIQPYTSYPTGGAKAHGLTTANPLKSIHKQAGTAYQGPLYDAYDYLVEPSSYDASKFSSLTAAEIAGKRTRKKDSYVLISAGRDRIYGTEDDIVNFGSVLP